MDWAIPGVPFFEVLGVALWIRSCAVKITQVRVCLAELLESIFSLDKFRNLLWGPEVQLHLSQGPARKDGAAPCRCRAGFLFITSIGRLAPWLGSGQRFKESIPIDVDVAVRRPLVSRMFVQKRIGPDMARQQLDVGAVFQELSWFGFGAMFVFTIPLAIGLIYEWMKGGLEW